MWFRKPFDSRRTGSGRPPRRPTGRLSLDALEGRSVPASLAVSDATIIEGDTGTQNAVVAVRLSAPSTRTVTVDYRTADVTAVAGSDYVAVSGRLTFNPGVTSQSELGIRVCSSGTSESLSTPG